jgi:hypothetical protein
MKDQTFLKNLSNPIFIFSFNLRIAIPQDAQRPILGATGYIGKAVAHALSHGQRTGEMHVD